MDHNDVKQSVKRQFGRNAEKYVVSPGHAQGDDLTWLVEWLNPQPSWNVLDVATGGGHVAKKLAPLVSHIIAADLTREMLHAARKHLNDNHLTNVSYVVSDAEAMPFLDCAFDLVACRIAAHHFPNSEAFIAESARVLVPGGKFLFIDNVSPENPTLSAFHNRFEQLRDESHVQCLSVPAWTHLFAQNQLRLIQNRLFQKKIPFMPWMERMSVSDAHTAAVEDFILNGPSDALHHFQVEVVEGRLRSLVINTWMALCEKADTPSSV